MFAHRDCMARPLRLHIPGMVYHVMSRGNAKQVIFTDDRDYERYLEILEYTLQRFHVECLAYCLLLNHLHLLVRPTQFPISRMMQQLNSTYCQWFNRRHQRVGHVLQGRPKMVFVDNHDSLLRVVRYIVLNPVEAGCVRHPVSWRWSSYRATAGFDSAERCVDVAAVWEAFGPDARTAQTRFAEYVDTATDSAPLPGGLILGSDTFVRQFEPMLRPHRSNVDFIIAERFAARPLLSELFADAAQGKPSRTMVRQAFDEHAYTLREIAAHVGRSAATAWSWIRHARHQRLGSETEADGPLQDESLTGA
jgi:REP element-mobilizing transposase RayT